MEPDHGTRYMYQTMRCRCKLCRGWNAGYSKDYRRRRMERTGEILLHGYFLPGKDNNVNSQSQVNDDHSGLRMVS